MKNSTIHKLRIVIVNIGLVLILLLNFTAIQPGSLGVSVDERTIFKRTKSAAETILRVPHSLSGEINVSLMGEWGSFGSEDGNFNVPCGIAINNTDYVYVADYNNHRVQVFKSNGTFIFRFGSQGSLDGQFNGPRCIAINSTGYIYVTEFGNNRIQIFTPNGTFIGKWGSQGSGQGQFEFPWGIAINSTGYVYVVDNNNHRIQVFTPNGTFVQTWGTQGSGDGELSGPEGIAIDSAGNVYVTEYANRRVQVFTPNGTFIREFGFGLYETITVDDDTGYVYVGEQDEIYVYTKNGTFIRKWGSSAIGGGKFQGLHGIAIDSEGYIYVADTNNHRIQVFLHTSPQLYISMHNLLATNQTINVTFIVKANAGNEVDDVLLEISNTTLDWSGNTTQGGQYNLSLAYTPNEFTLEVNASKVGYSAGNATFVIYIDPPAVEYTEPVEELDTSALATFGLISLIFIGPWAALGIRHLQIQRKKRTI